MTISSLDPAAPIGRPGLTAADAAERLCLDGPNLLPVAPAPPAWRVLVGQMVHFFAIMLWVAGGLAFVMLAVVFFFRRR